MDTVGVQAYGLSRRQYSMVIPLHLSIKLFSLLFSFYFLSSLSKTKPKGLYKVYVCRQTTFAYKTLDIAPSSALYKLLYIAICCQPVWKKSTQNSSLSIPSLNRSRGKRETIKAHSQNAVFRMQNMSILLWGSC